MQSISSAHRSNSRFVSLSQISRFTEKLLVLACLLVSLPMLSSPAIAQTLVAASSAAELGTPTSTQSAKGLIAGTVVDSQGAAVPGAQLKLRLLRSRLSPTNRENSACPRFPQASTH